MKYVFILAILLSSHTVSAIEIDDVEIQLGLNYTCTEMPPNTLWYQEEFAYSIKRCDEGYQLGLRFKILDNVYFSTGYKYLGRFEIESDFIGNDDVYYGWQKGGPRPPLSHLKGSGKVDGFYAKAEYHFSSGFFLTGGWWAHKAEWYVRSPAEYLLITVGPRTGEFIGPLDREHDNKAGYVMSWIAGVGYKFGQFSVLAEIWDIENGGKSGYPSTYLGNSQVVTLLYTF